MSCRLIAGVVAALSLIACKTNAGAQSGVLTSATSTLRLHCPVFPYAGGGEGVATSTLLAIETNLETATVTYAAHDLPPATFPGCGTDEIDYDETRLSQTALDIECSDDGEAGRISVRRQSTGKWTGTLVFPNGAPEELWIVDGSSYELACDQQ